MWGHFKDGILKAYDEVCGKKRGRSKGVTRWRDEEVKEAVSWKADVHKAMCQTSTEENKSRYKNMENEAKKAVSNAMKQKAEEMQNE